jgi:hypothetical protein
VLSRGARLILRLARELRRQARAQDATIALLSALIRYHHAQASRMKVGAPMTVDFLAVRPLRDEAVRRAFMHLCEVSDEAARQRAIDLLLADE